MGTIRRIVIDSEIYWWCRKCGRIYEDMIMSIEHYQENHEGIHL